MTLKLKEIRKEYNLTLKELSEITDIPEKTIESWENGLSEPSPWVGTLLIGYLKQYPKNQYGIVTQTKGIYTVEQIKELLLPLTSKYRIDQIILFGDYANNAQNAKSHIEVIIKSKIKQNSFANLTEEVAQIFVKNIELFHEAQIEKHSEIYKKMKQGIILYTIGLSYNQIIEMI